MNIDQAIKAAQERIHRQIGQWGRAAHRRVAEVAQRHREAIRKGYIRVLIPANVTGYSRDYEADVPEDFGR